MPQLAARAPKYPQLKRVHILNYANLVISIGGTATICDALGAPPPPASKGVYGGSEPPEDGVRCGVLMSTLD